MLKSIRRLSLVSALGVGLTLIAGLANAAIFTVSFTSRAHTEFGRDNDILYPGFSTGSGILHESMFVEYNTSGLPYAVSKVVYTSNAANGINFKATADGAVSEPVTFASIGGFSVDPASAATLVGGDGVNGNSVEQLFGVGVLADGSDSEFQQGLGNAEVTYVQIRDGATELASDNLNDFNGSMVFVTFTKISDTAEDGTDVSALPDEFTLSGAYAVQSTPVGDPLTNDVASTGADIDFEVVPEPGPIAMLLALGVGGTSVLLRRRR
jgi:hypothetical protein